MRYLLDTNTCIRYLNGTSIAIRQRLQSVNAIDIAVCSIVKAELFYGAMRSTNPTQTLAQQQQFLQVFRSLPVDDPAALVAGRIRAQLFTAGVPIGANDVWIAAIALSYDLTLVTHNTNEFQRIFDLRLEDWEVVAEI